MPRGIRPLAFAAWVLAGLVMLAGCAPPRPPAAEVRGALGLGEEPTGADADVAFEIAHAAPRGPVTEAAEITVVFSKPVRAMGGPEPPPPELRIEPPTQGRWHWVGSRALRFEPEQPLPPATEHVVTVPAGVRSLAGDVLDEPLTWSFSTPAPSLMGRSPDPGSTHVPVGDPIELRFDQRLDPGMLTEAVTLSAKLPVDAAVGPPTTREVTLPFTVDPIDDEGHHFRVVPRAVMPAGARVRVAVGAVRPARGELASAPTSFEFTTWGPLRVLDATCTPAGRDRWADVHDAKDDCSPDGVIRVSLTNYVEPELLAKYVDVSPSIGEIAVEASYEEGGGQAYSISGAFAPQTTYEVRVRRVGAAGALVDDQGQSLVSDFVTRLRFGDHATSATMLMSGTYGPRTPALSIPLSLMNAARVRLAAARVTPDDVMARLARTGAPPVLAWGPEKQLEDAPRNAAHTPRVDLASLVVGPLTGPVAVRLGYDEGGELYATHRSVTHEIQLTDLAVFLRVSSGRVHAWVLDASTGAAASGVEVSLRSTGDANILRQTTDVHGRATLVLPPTAPLPASIAKTSDSPGARPPAPTRVVFVRRGDDWSYHVLGERAPEAEAVGVLFTDRGLYRPGETVSMKGIVRVGSADGLTTPAGEEISGEIRGPDGQIAARFTATASPFGSFSTTFVAPPDAPLGLYGVRLAPPYRYVGTRFTVAEYHPAEFSVEASLSKAELVRGEEVQCTASGRYLYGSPMVGAAVRLGLSRSHASFRPPGFDGYDFDDDRDWASGDVGPEERATLDAGGRHTITRRADLPEMRGPEHLHCSVAATDLNHRALTGGDSALVHPAELYVGVKAPSHLHPGDAFDAHFVAVTRAGRETDAEVSASLRLLTQSSPGAPFDERILADCKARTGGAGKCKFTVPPEALDPLRQLRVRAFVTDAAGRVASTSTEVYVQPRPVVVTPPPPPPPVDPPRPVLSILGVPDTVEVGGALDFEVTSPYAGSAKLLVSIEREDVLVERIVTLPAAGTRVRIPVSAAMVPNATIHLAAALGSRLERASREFRVSPEGHRLDVDLSLSKEIAAPGEAIDVEVTVTDRQGRPVHGEVTLWGADEGTLMLAMYNLPDPFGAIFTDRSAWLPTFDTRDHALKFGWRHRSRAPKVRMGATSVSGRNPRADFRQSVLFEPGLVTDERGKVRHRVTLPDGLTTYRFFAVVATERDAFGGAEAELKTQQRLMARPSLPAVVRTGDRFAATVVLSTVDLPAAKVDVEIVAEGVSVVGSPTRTLQVSPGVPARVELPLSAPTAGPFRVTVRARASGKVRAEDAFSVSGEVTTPTFIEYATIAGEADRPVSELVGDLSAARPDVGELTLALSSSPLVGAERGMEDLLRYPYGCNEQTLSQLLPLVVLRDLARELRAELPENPEAMASEGVGRVLASQRSDGGFGFWSGSRVSEAWITSYALVVLSEAKKKGLAVPSETLASASAFLRGELAEIFEQEHPSAGDLDIAAFALDALVTASEPVRAEAEQVFAHRAELSLSGRALLLHAVARADDAPRHLVRAMTDAVEGSIRSSAAIARAIEVGTRSASDETSRLVLDSSVQGSALSLRALLAVDPKHLLATPLARGLLADRKAGAWQSTHETAWVLLALDAYRRAQPSAPEAFGVRVFLGEALVAHPELGDGTLQATVSVPIDQLRGQADRDPGADKLTLDVEAGGRLYYEAQLRFARRKLPTEPLDHGFSVERTTTLLGGASGLRTASSPRGELSAGDLVRVDLTVVSSSPRRAVAIEAPLPGGLAALAPELLDDTPEDEDFPRYDVAGRLWDRRELRDDRVLFFVDRMPAGVSRFTFYARALHPGSYVVPPATAFEMYAPEVRGATATERLRVQSPP